MGQVDSKTELSDADIDFIKANTTYDEYTIRKWWDDFQKDCPDGKMTVDQMTGMCKMVFPDLNMDEYGSHMARVFDTDQDGFIDFKEFLVGMNATTQGSEREKVMNVFKMFDVDGNKLVDLKEMIQILKASHNALFIEGDTDIESEAKLLFDKMDTNKDGIVTEAEFLDTVGKQQ